MSTYQVRIRADVREKGSKRDRGGREEIYIRVSREEIYIRVSVEALDAEDAAQRVSTALADLLDGRHDTTGTNVDGLTWEIPEEDT